MRLRGSNPLSWASAAVAAAAMCVTIAPASSSSQVEVNLGVHPPPSSNRGQRQHLLLSTATDFVSLPCHGCASADCGSFHPHPFFDPRMSADSVAVSKCPGGCSSRRHDCMIPEGDNDPCMLMDETVGGLGGKYNSYEVRDMASVDTIVPDGKLGSTAIFPLALQCQIKVSGPLVQSSTFDGILGMSLAPSSFLSQIHAHGVIKEPTFSLCLGGRDPSKAKDIAPEGHGEWIKGATIGDVDTSHHTIPLVWARNSHLLGTTPYTVRIRGIYLRKGVGADGPGGRASAAMLAVDGVPIRKLDNVDYEAINGVNYGVAVDPDGERFTHINAAAEWAFAAAWESMAGHGLRWGYRRMEIPQGRLAELPTILLQLEAADSNDPSSGTSPIPGTAGYAMLDHVYRNDVILAIPPENYLEYDSVTGTFSSRFYVNHEGGNSVLGANAFRGRDVAFDVRRKRIGIAENDGSCTEGVRILKRPQTEMVALADAGTYSGPGMITSFNPGNEVLPSYAISARSDGNDGEYTPIMQPNDDRDNAAAAGGLGVDIHPQVSTSNIAAGVFYDSNAPLPNPSATEAAPKDGNLHVAQSQSHIVPEERYTSGESGLWSIMALGFLFIGFGATLFLSKPKMKRRTSDGSIQPHASEASRGARENGEKNGNIPYGMSDNDDGSSRKEEASAIRLAAYEEWLAEQERQAEDEGKALERKYGEESWKETPVGHI